VYIYARILTFNKPNKERSRINAHRIYTKVSTKMRYTKNLISQNVFKIISNYYFCSMKIKQLSVIVFLLGITGVLSAQSFVRTSDLFQKYDANYNTGRLEIYQPPELDSLIKRHILFNQNQFKVNNHYGMDGYRIQIYNNNNRNARDESTNIRVAFMSRYPDVTSYQLYADPGYFRVRVGDFRTKAEAVKLLQRINREFPNAYIVPCFINFPELNIK